MSTTEQGLNDEVSFLKMPVSDKRKPIKTEPKAEIYETDYVPKAIKEVKELRGFAREMLHAKKANQFMASVINKRLHLRG